MTLLWEIPIRRKRKKDLFIISVFTFKGSVRKEKKQHTHTKLSLFQSYNWMEVRNMYIPWVFWIKQGGLIAFSFQFYHAGNLGRLTRVRLKQPQKQRYPFLTMRVVLSCVQTKVWLPVLGIFNMRTDVQTCDCTGGLYRHLRTVCTESWLREKNPLPHWGIEPVSAVSQFDTLPTELQPLLFLHLVFFFFYPSVCFS